MASHDEVLCGLTDFLNRLPQVSYIADHGAGKRKAADFNRELKLPVGGRRPDIHMWIGDEEYCVNVTSGSLLKRNRLTAQILAWQRAGVRIICVCSPQDVVILRTALVLCDIPPLAGVVTFNGFKDYVQERYYFLIGDTPKPL